MEAMNLEVNPEEMKFTAVHVKVSKEKAEAAVQTVRALKKQYGD
jgi:hypothetical protein